ncbi:Low-density lipoprotein (LDL) receptor class A repeat and Chitin binding domain-containing protein [Strongyloides ratti]|uniref:Low-density lipoprotein (LDL) receptor class A repeat and Chitin binding domain-containing protein n=1 Tax=Strongyloides ratti TaxID=34506 RepID=A0A090LIP8_STRRB|nr:Low-density lipoprotein (LDL) receptor class A repeat and Chitin binding domain-containing protein [Strongyloides ratti]CEF69618.1 Low-density lipoprotein (LDL) receptor class A repeat and Chitin binding domain-containing protein [Strongyloides ratti]
MRIFYFYYIILPSIIIGQQFPIIDINSEINRIASQFRSSQGSIPQKLIYPSQVISNGFSGGNSYPKINERIDVPTQPPYIPHQEIYKPQPPYVPKQEIYQPRPEPIQEIPNPPQPSRPRIITTTASSRLDYAINYCDTKEFPDHVLETYNLKRVDYFIYNTSCSHIYFQCSIGQTFKLQCLTSELAFNDEVGTCDHKNAVKYCPEYDHILHCSIQDSCTENQFACCAHPQKCIDLSHRCDGVSDCSDGEDENNCPSCGRDQFACVKSGVCIPAEKRCDGHPDDCGDGSNLDELNCSKNSTCWGKFICDSQISKSILGRTECIDLDKHCNGVADCPGKEDERNCKVNETKYLLCENQKQSVKKNQWCDGVPHCMDKSDEKYCS